MKLNEQDIKEGLKASLESPSYGFNVKTMRLIEEQKNLSEIYTPIRVNKWILSGIITAFVLCVGFSFTITPDDFTILKKLNFEIPMTFPEINIFWMWGLTFSSVALGLWISILWLQKINQPLNSKSTTYTSFTSIFPPNHF